jgi:hypothetical protein
MVVITLYRFTRMHFAGEFNNLPAQPNNLRSVWNAPNIQVNSAMGVSISLSYPPSAVFIEMLAADELLVRYRLHKQGLLEEPVEQHGPPQCEAAIKPGRKLIEAVGEMGMTNRPLMCPQPPAF